MGLLDELEQEAQRRKATADDAGKRKAEREQVFLTQIEPGLGALYEYLQKLTASLKILTPKKQQRYVLNGYGEVVGYIEHDYDLKISAQPGNKEIKLSFPCAIAGEECPTIEVQGASKVKTVAGAFQRYHFGGMRGRRRELHKPRGESRGTNNLWCAASRTKWQLSVLRGASRDDWCGRHRLSRRIDIELGLDQSALCIRLRRYAVSFVYER